MRWKAIDLLLVAALAAMLLALSATTKASARPLGTTVSCSEKYLIIGSRASGEKLGGNPVKTKYGKTVRGMGQLGDAFAAAFINRFPAGVVQYVANPYPAVSIGGGWRSYINALGARLPIPHLGAYSASVKEGVADLNTLVRSEAITCPRVRVILVGYSQGAEVTGDAIQAYDWKNMAFALLYGDPKFNGDDDAVGHGTYDRELHGIRGKRPDFDGHAFLRVLSLCYKFDPICQWRGIRSYLRHGMTEHNNYGTYVADNLVTEAVDRAKNWP